MKIVTFKAIPYYEYNRDGIYAVFNGDGLCTTNDEKVIEALSKCEPFIKRLDAEPKAQPKPKATASTRRTTNK